MNANISENKLNASKIIFALLLISTNAFSQYASRHFLGGLQGKWIMTGTVLKKTVKYNAEGSRILDNQWLCFHMMDAERPPKYEASLYIGIDSAKNEYVGHWLDIFGGAGARVVATGPLTSDKIELFYPYPEGRFRNLFTYDSQNNEWTLLIESEDANGNWSEFAKYKIKRE